MTVLIPVGVKSLAGVGSDPRRGQELGVSLKTTLFHPTPVGEGHGIPEVYDSIN